MDLAYEQEAKIIQEMIEYAKQGNRVCILGKGTSMRPLLVDGRDYIYMDYITDHSKLRRGDVVFYYVNDKYILHRIYRITEQGYEMLGDGNLLVEPPIDRSNIFLIAREYVRNGRKISAEVWYLKLYGRLWMRIRRFRPRVRRVVSFFRRKGNLHEN